MRVVITGSRTWSSYTRVLQYLKQLKGRCDARGESLELLQGGARGVDSFANSAALALGIRSVTEKAQWEQYGKRAGAIRNRVMLDTNPDLVIGFLHTADDLTKSGTLDCLRAAMERGLDCELVTE